MTAVRMAGHIEDAVSQDANLGNLVNMMQGITPRDIDVLKVIKALHLNLFKIKITPVSPVLGFALPEIFLPPHAVVMFVKRGQHAIFPGEFDRLQGGDLVVLLAPGDHEAELRQLFTIAA